MDTADWYVLVTSASGDTVFATLGPFLSRAVAEQKASESRLAQYRVEQARQSFRSTRVVGFSSTRPR